MANGMIVNNADGSNIEKANLAAAQYRSALHLFPLPPSGWSPKVLTYSGYYNTGIKEIWDMVDEYMAFVQANGYFEVRRNAQAKYWMYESINEQLRTHFYQSPEIEKALQIKEKQVLNSELSSFAAAQQMLDLYFNALYDASSRG